MCLNMLVSKKRIILCFLFLLLFNNCSTILPGINKDPQKKNSSNKIQVNEYSIEDVKVNVIKINELSDKEIKKINNNNVKIEMTLTNPNCPVAGQMPENVGKSIENLVGLKSIQVKLVWEPVWNKNLTLTSSAEAEALNVILPP